MILPNKIIKFLVHSLLRYKKVRIYAKEFAKRINNKKILEIGSGKKVDGRYIYSFKKIFNNSNEFIQSDINRSYGHRIIDVNKMNFKNEFDIIICSSVLEHNFHFQKAINNIYIGLKKGGITWISVPANYPLHDEPNDYWRFTEHSLRILFKKFKNIKIKVIGFRKFPSGYIVEAKK